MYIKQQSFLVLGASKSGKAVCEYLIQNDCKNCYIYEQLSGEKVEKNLQELSKMGVKNFLEEYTDEILKEIDVLVLSPGVPINHPISVKAKQLGKRIMGELEFAYSTFIPPIIAITGTNGKTTTVNLIYQILINSHKNTRLLGNVGVPFTSEISNIKRDEVTVVEVSSFQLESTFSFCPHISCILNVTPDHLDRHYTMENYVFLKKKIFKNQRQSEYIVLNYDDETVRGFASETNAKIIWVSTKEKVDGAYLLDGKLYYKNQFIVDQDSLSILGEHNVYNCLFAIVCTYLLGVKIDIIKEVLIGFKGVKNRMEFVCEIDGVKYLNDSKATNTASTISAIQCIKEPTILILGGYDKKEDYQDLFEKIKTSLVKHVILTGNTRFKMLEIAGVVGISDITITSDFDLAVKIASMIALPGDMVLLSPACSSFDAFSSYEERGNRFRFLVEKLSDKRDNT